MIQSSTGRLSLDPTGWDARADAPSFAGGAFAVERRVSFSGELDIASVPHLRQTLTAALSDARIVVLDMADVSFVDCAALQMILSASREAIAASRRLRITGCGPQVRRLFEVVGELAELNDRDPGPTQPPASTRHAMSLEAA